MIQDEPGYNEVNAPSLQSTSPEAGPADSPQPAPPGVRLTARFQPALNAALWQNHVPMLSELTVVNASDQALGDLEIELSSQPPVLHARTWRVAGLAPEQMRTFDDLDIPVDGLFLSGLSEAVRATVTLVARSGGKPVGEFTQGHTRARAQ